MSTFYELMFMLTFTIGSLFFLLLLFFAYFAKKMIYQLKNKLFIVLLGNAFLQIVSEIIQVAYLAYGKSDVISHLIIKVHWTTGYVWGILIVLYCIVTVREEKYKNGFMDFFNNVYLRFYFLISAIGFVVFLFIPIGKVTFETFSFNVGAMSYFVMSYCLISLLITYVLLVANSQFNFTMKNRIILSFIFLVIVVFGLVQLILPRVAMYCRCASNVSFVLLL